jgi:hypothetical protein
VAGHRLPYQKIHAVDDWKTEFPGFLLDLTVHGINLKLGQSPCALKQKNSHQFSSRSFPLKVADYRLATIQTQRRALRNVKPDRRTSTLTTPDGTDSVDLREKASQIVRTLLEQSAKQL